MTKLDDIIKEVASRRKATFFKPPEKKYLEAVGQQTYHWFCRMLVKQRNLSKPLKPSWFKAIASFIAKNPQKAKEELEEARFEYVILSLLAHKDKRELVGPMYSVAMGRAFVDYLKANHGLEDMQINICVGHALHLSSVSISDILWAEHYYFQRNALQISLF